MTSDKNEWLRILAATAYSRTTGELMQALIEHRDCDLQSYEPLLIRVQEVLVTRYDSARVQHLLGHLNRPNRDTIVKNTGNLPTK
jgi:hypothetical protein